MSQRVRVGIVGTSWWADMMYLPSFKSHPAAEIVAICGRDRGRAEELAKTHGVAQVFTDYRALMRAGSIDAVVIATPDDLHHAMTMDALDAGLHVLCEKPLANNAAHARQMCDKAKVAGLKNMVLFTWRWQPHWRYLKRLVDEGYIGRCYQARFAFVGGQGRSEAYQWRLDGSRANGIVGDLGSHMIDFSRWYLGDIRKVSGHLSTLIDRSGFENPPASPANDAAFVSLETESGAQVMIQASAVSHVGNQLLRIIVQLYGDAGTIEAEQIFFGRDAGVTLRGIRRGDEEFRSLDIPEDFAAGTDPKQFLDPYRKQSAGPRLFIDAILKDLPATPDFHDGLKVQEVVDAALKSHEQKRWVNLIKEP